MKTFEITYPNGEIEVREATFIREKIDAGTKVLELYKTVSEYSSESKPYLFITGYSEVNEVEEIPIINGIVTLPYNSITFIHNQKWYERRNNISV